MGHTNIPDAPLADVVLSAERLIKRHGHEAALVAEIQAGQSLRNGDMGAYRTWKRIELMVDSLSGGLAPHEALHP
jgi:hypothetical protein